MEEVLHVAVDDGLLVGVSTAYIDRNDQLRMDLWHFRGFVAPEHRRSAVALDLLQAAQRHLEDRWVSGADTRAAGMALIVQHEGLKRHQPHGDWRRGGVTFIGEDGHGSWVRVRYFPGALAPLPEQS